MDAGKVASVTLALCSRCVPIHPLREETEVRATLELVAAGSRDQQREKEGGPCSPTHHDEVRRQLCGNLSQNLEMSDANLLH